MDQDEGNILPYTDYNNNSFVPGTLQLWQVNIPLFLEKEGGVGGGIRARAFNRINMLAF